MLDQPITTPYEYVGDIPALGSLQLTRLAKSYEELDWTPLSDFFPDVMIPEQTIVVETVKYGLDIMPIVKPGVPAGNFLNPGRVERRYTKPALVREDDFIDQMLINQLRRVGTFNEQYPPNQIIQDRVKQMVTRHNRTLEWFRVQVLLGGIDYYDPRTDYRIKVDTQIPAHNLFRYDGWNATLASGGVAGNGYVAGKNLTNNKGRTEALLFGDTNGRCGIPWTHPQADIVRCLRYLKQFLYNTNKNRYTDIVMSRDLYTIIQENELIKAYMGSVGILSFPNFTATSGNMNPSSSTAASAYRTPPFVSFGPGGDITSIGGLNIILIDNLFKNPETGEIKFMWPANKVAVVARNYASDPSQTLGFTHYCVAESPDGTPGMWMRTGPDQMPPATPGRTMQMGNAFLPFATYPQWICLMDVCELAEVQSNVLLQSNLSYGTF